MSSLCYTQAMDEKQKNIIEVYTEIAEPYDKEYGNNIKYRAEIDKFLSMLDGKKILDIGCGAGVDVAYLIEKAFDPLGVDLTPKFLEMARKRVPNGKFEQADITDLQFADNTFDGIVSNCSLHHVPSESLDKTFRGLNRVLKPNGKLLVFIPNGKGEGFVNDPFDPSKKIFVNFISAEKLTQLLNQNNFKKLSYKFLKSENETDFADGEISILARKC